MVSTTNLKHCGKTVTSPRVGDAATKVPAVCQKGYVTAFGKLYVNNRFIDLLMAKTTTTYVPGRFLVNDSIMLEPEHFENNLILPGNCDVYDIFQPSALIGNLITVM